MKLHTSGINILRNIFLVIQRFIVFWRSHLLWTKYEPIGSAQLCGFSNSANKIMMQFAEHFAINYVVFEVGRNMTFSAGSAS